MSTKTVPIASAAEDQTREISYRLHMVKKGDTLSVPRVTTCIR
jgi:hypothetical protein